ncbi:hypothetical protein P153DRAFT_361886 [Dothidotthia symphoricarpi CBS 119687]|uniref:Uncharacterized protein n=1 Tax=Dothidotthia symphoricarpi CBS 119687 TaxID=1392245 RepID=A0A6A5ZZA8_9PLEO|nr:uncharacterized protein P153DRAFT_361886 [Dothidotthia symphoricarpi CBS 119687]KAF2123651.1 hypothetical protein P153DRAFT_361886 [Dothidotthia symphoricarpi CBS 119687]
MRTGRSISAPELGYTTRNEILRAVQFPGSDIAPFCGFLPGDRIANMMTALQGRDTDSSLVGITANSPLHKDDGISITCRSFAPFSIMGLSADDSSSIKEPRRRENVYIAHLVEGKLPMICCPVENLADRDHVDLKVGTAHFNLPLLRHLMKKTLGPGLIDSLETIVRRDFGAIASILAFRITTPETTKDPARIGAFLKATLAQVIPC